jgi:Tol biopolymer transport system component
MRAPIKYTRIIGARPDPNGFYSFARFNSASTSTNGRRIAFLSIADLVGNSNDGNFEIFLLDLTKACTQITDTTDKSYFGNHSTAFLNADGTHVAFRSEANLTGNNADGNWEIILLDVITNTLTQIAGTIGSDNSGLSITAGGARIAFVSTAD